MLVLREELCVFEEQETSYLQELASETTYNDQKAILFNTSKHMRPSLSIFGWYILVRNLILGGVIG